MGLFSKIKKGFKKVGSKLKGAIKKVARGVKKVAKKVAHAIPGGKQLWDLGTKIGKGVMKGVGKVMGKLGPVGIMAIQVVLSATGVGAGISAAMGSMWSSMGAVASASAAAGSVMGTVANAAFNAVNWVGGTLGAVGEALAGGAKQLVNGNFSSAASTFGTNMSNALTGKAGNLAMSEAATKAIETGVGNIGDKAISAGSDALATSGGTLAGLGETAAEQVGSLDVTKASEATKPWYQKVGEAALDAGQDFVKDKGKSFIKTQAKSLLSKKTTSQPAAGYQPLENPYDLYDAVQGSTFAAPSQGQAIQAAQVGGGQQQSSYYNPNAFD